MKTLQVLEPEKLSYEELLALRRIGFFVSAEGMFDQLEKEDPALMEWLLADDDQN